MQRHAQQLLNLSQGIRLLKTQLLIADEAGELPADFRQWALKELGQCMLIVEVKE